jgi:Flp pilus assembly protein CpaB
MATQKKRAGRVIIIITLILIVGLALVYILLTSKQGSGNSSNSAKTATPSVELVDIVVASQTIPRGTLITSDYLTTIKYPKNQMPANTFFGKVEDAVGTKAKITIDPGVPLTTSEVFHENEGSLASFDIPTGMVAASIAISPETAVAYAPQQGDHVTVVGCLLLVDVDTAFQTILPNLTAVTFKSGSIVSSGTTSGSASSSMVISAQGVAQGHYVVDTSSNDPIYVIPSEQQRSREVCQTIIQDAEVLKVGTFPIVTDNGTTIQPTPIVNTANQSGTPVPSGSIYPGSVTLIVSPQDNIILTYLETSGTTLSLALRSAGDTSTITTDPVTLQYVMDQKNIPSPAKAPYSTDPRVDKLVFPTFNDFIISQP